MIKKYLVPEDLLDDASDARSGHDPVEAVVPEVTEEAGGQAEAEAHVKRPVKIDAEILRFLLLLTILLLFN